MLLGAWCWVVAIERQRKPERGALANRALHAHYAAVALDDRLADIEPQAQPDTRATLLLDARYTKETLEEVRLLLGGQAQTMLTLRVG